MGIGWWASVLADAAGRAGTFRLIGGTARTAEKREAFAKKYGGRAYESYDKLLADPEIEGVIVTTPHTAHAEHVIAAAQAGKHIFVDKPFALTLADARRAADACRKAGVVLAIGHQRRRQAASRAIKTMIDEGALGRIAQIEGNMSADGGFAMVKPGAWRGDVSEAPGGSMTNLGIHHVDTYQYLLGPIARVMAISRQVALTGVDVHDVTSILFEFASGTVGYLGTSWVHATRTSYITLHGTDAQAWSEGDGVTLFVAKRGETERTLVPLTPVDAIVAELREFAECVREKRRPEVSGDEGIATIAVLEAIVESAKTGHVVEVARP